MSSYRFCRNCVDFTKWEVDEVVNHSYCINCGQRFGMSNVNKIKIVVVEHFQKEIGKLQSKRDKLMNRLDEMRKKELAKGRKNVNESRDSSEK